MRILIVDDEKINRIFLSKLLKGHEIIFSNSGEDSLDLMNQDIDLVFMDQHMAKLDGSGALQIFRDRGFRACRFLVTGDTDLYAKNFPAGLVRKVIHKPINAEEINKALESCLSSKEPEHAKKINESIGPDIQEKFKNFKPQLQAYLQSTYGIEIDEFVDKTPLGEIEGIMNNSSHDPKELSPKQMSFKIDRVYDCVKTLEKECFTGIARNGHISHEEMMVIQPAILDAMESIAIVNDFILLLHHKFKTRQVQEEKLLTIKRNAMKKRISNFKG